MYAYEISKELRGRFSFSTATVTVYVVLYKMRREGLVKLSPDRHSASAKNRPARKYYEITELGKQTLLRGKDLIKKVIHLLE